MSIWARDGGLLLGHTVDHGGISHRPRLGKPLRYVGDRHICLIGPNGTGKTKRLLIPVLAANTGWTIVVADIKGELCAMTMRHRQRAGNRIIRLNPFNVLDLGSDGFNPIAALQLTKEFPDDAMQLAEAIIRVPERDPHWAQAAQEVITALIMYVRLVMPDGGSFSDVRQLLGRDENGWRALVRGGLDTDPVKFSNWHKTPPDKRDPRYLPPVVHNGKLYPGMISVATSRKWPQIETKIARFGSITPENREMHGVIGEALVQTRWLDSPSVQEDLKKNPFDYRVIRDTPTTVYLMLPANRLVTHSAWLRLMVASVIQMLISDFGAGEIGSGSYGTCAFARVMRSGLGGAFPLRPADITGLEAVHLVGLYPVLFEFAKGRLLTAQTAFLPLPNWGVYVYICASSCFQSHGGKNGKIRREELDILEEEHAADERKLRALLERMDKRKEQIDPKREARIDEENRYIGSIARLLVADDTALKRRFVQQAVKTYGGVGDTRARRYLERLIGKVPVIHPDTAKPDDVMDAAAE